MTEHHPAQPPGGPDDGFERALRDVLHDRASGPLPASLRPATGRPSGRGGPTRASIGPILRTLGGLAAVVLLGVIGVQALSPSPRQHAGASTSGVPSASPAAPAIVWDSGEVRLTAAALRIRAGGLEFTGQVPDVRVDGDPGSATYRTLEVEWSEHGREQRLYLYLAADDVSWWVTEVRTRDGQPQAEWITYAPPAFRLAIGGTWNGDLRLSAPRGSLEIRGMSLRAFAPDTIPDSLDGCRPARAGAVDDPLQPGQPLAGSSIERMTPAGAKQVLAGMGLCHTFRYEYTYSDGSGGYGEIWCDPPPGRIMELTYGSDGEVIVFVVDAVRQQHSPRPQPPVGWGC